MGKKKSKEKSKESIEKPQLKQDVVETISPIAVVDNTMDSEVFKYHTKGGTGFAAEDANALADKLSGKKVEKVGRNNVLNGPDRISDGVKIQVKYYASSRETINAAFNEEGVYRYPDQMLEVPSDQYDDALKLMEQKIRDGKVAGYKRPSRAKELVKKGSVTYKQAKNIAKAGNIDSLTYDAKSQAVVSGYVFAVSFSINFAQGIWNGQSGRDSLENAFKVGLASGSKTFVTGVVANQILRSRVSAHSTILVRHGMKELAKTSVGKDAITKIATTVAGKPLFGAAATNYVSKMASSNAVVGTLVTLYDSRSDVYRTMIEGSASWGQLLKNLVGNAGSIFGGIVAAGTASAYGSVQGAVAGKAIGGLIGGILGSVVPGAGTAAGATLGAGAGAWVGWAGGLVAGGAAGSAVGGGIARAAMGSMIEDDAVKMLQAVHSALVSLSNDYLLTKEETEQFIFMTREAVEGGLLKELYKVSKGDVAKATEEAIVGLEVFTEALVSYRPRIELPDPNECVKYIEEISNNISSKEEASSSFSIGSLVHTRDFSFAGISIGNERVVGFYDSQLLSVCKNNQTLNSRIGIIRFEDLGGKEELVGIYEPSSTKYPPLRIAARALAQLGKDGQALFDDDSFNFCEWCAAIPNERNDLAKRMEGEGFLPTVGDRRKENLNAYFNQDNSFTIFERELQAFSLWQYFNQRSQFPLGESFVHSSQAEKKEFKSCAGNAGKRVLFCYYGSLLSDGNYDWYLTEKGFCWPSLNKFVPYYDITSIEADFSFLKLKTHNDEHRFPIFFTDSESIEYFIFSLITGLPIRQDSLKSCFSAKFKQSTKALLGGLCCSGCLCLFPPVAAIMLCLTPLMMLAALFSKKNETFIPYCNPNDDLFFCLPVSKAIIQKSIIPPDSVLPKFELLQENETAMQIENAEFKPLEAKIDNSINNFVDADTIFTALLIVGIIVAPYLFAWVTLQEKYSAKFRLFAFGWLLILLLIASAGR